MNAKQIWQTAIERLQAKVPHNIFTTWFQGTTGLSFQDGVFTVGVSTPFAKSHLEHRFADPIRFALGEVIGNPVEVQIVVAKERPQTEATTDILFSPPRRPHRLGKHRPSLVQREKHLAETGANPKGFILPLQRLNKDSVNQPAQEQTWDDEPPARSPIQIPATPGLKTVKSSTPYTGESQLNPRYTFDAFIVGKSNQLAHAASKAAAEKPGQIYNPLFLYGGVGLGKTHLLHAVGHEGESKGLTVLYVTSEKFTNEIINAIRYQKTEEFRAKYRQIDILLVDDIQFIAGKESTEEEFFHTFNTLHNANKQIVVTSDRPPKAIHSLQDRLRSRFEWGLLADVQPPEYEHRLAILRSKTELLHFPVPNEVIEYIARPERANVRELEGALNRVIAYATLHNVDITTHIAEAALENLYTERKHTPIKLTVEEVLEGVCRYYNVEIERIRSKQRDREIAWPRQVAMYLMREETTASLQQIGAALGGRDHTTIMHGWEKVQAEIKNNERVRHEIAAVLESLQHRP
ncbi:chromosomal replication initiator protein [Thermosporothrix hazakensis]|jgi:chromosomal replication initiator protein|uniref:Chromosomal replication initiator protein DnaA n=2 Tax=Thermosporothrix TaxID=768650 RepID=A0A326UET7_THEHA|nr:chromosomal replication initiator protein DnaA [Thermosporothrix hazakensis]PZW36554.1 chromosomal replication initiator protein [Thermosporothrix hazakensis]BBH89021.1 chromosomal replication initiator protein DnaA [Thermosporothrix sp. COM3]GCE47205.1 chromosomal replication initiator protein DnaA [Thermosporothrix hazakensis]